MPYTLLAEKKVVTHPAGRLKVNFPTVQRNLGENLALFASLARTAKHQVKSSKIAEQNAATHRARHSNYPRASTGTNLISLKRAGQRKSLALTELPHSSGMCCKSRGQNRRHCNFAEPLLMRVPAMLPVAEHARKSAFVTNPITQPRSFVR